MTATGTLLEKPIEMANQRRRRRGPLRSPAPAGPSHDAAPDGDVERSPVSTVDELLERAESQKGLGIEYRLGGGAVRAARSTCADGAHACDCSAFVCWALGIDKQGSYPYLVPPGRPVEPGNQWYGTANIWHDAVHLEVGLFQQIADPLAGCIIVFPSRRRPDAKATPSHSG